MLVTADHLPSTSESARAEEMAAIQYRAPVPFLEAIKAPTAPAAHAILAFVSDNRWCVECPDCAEAQLACPGDKRFLCNGCANVAIVGKFRPVAWPKNQAKVEAALLARQPANRHWFPQNGETLADLVAENKAHGVAA